MTAGLPTYIVSTRRFLLMLSIVTVIDKISIYHLWAQSHFWAKLY